jgi:hypothetical protein
MMEPIRNIWEWIKQDWHSNPWRFIIEVICWLDSLACAVIVNSTVPNVPWLIMYPLWVGGTLCYAWCAYSRGSFGMLATGLMIASMDAMGWIKVLFG